MYAEIAHFYAIFLFFFFKDPAPTEIYPLPLPDALPTSATVATAHNPGASTYTPSGNEAAINSLDPRSEEHTSELQSPCNLVCRLLLEKKKRFVRMIMLSYAGGQARHSV